MSQGCAGASSHCPPPQPTIKYSGTLQTGYSTVGSLKSSIVRVFTMEFSIWYTSRHPQEPVYQYPRSRTVFMILPTRTTIVWKAVLPTPNLPCPLPGYTLSYDLMAMTQPTTGPCDRDPHVPLLPQLCFTKLPIIIEWQPAHPLGEFPR